MLVEYNVTNFEANMSITVIYLTARHRESSSSITNSLTLKAALRGLKARVRFKTGNVLLN